MSSVAELDWKRRKLEILNKIEQFQRTGRVSRGFASLNNADELRRRLYRGNKYRAQPASPTFPGLKKELLAPDRSHHSSQINRRTTMPPQSKPASLPPIPSPSRATNASKSNKLKSINRKERSEDSRTFTISPINFRDMVRESDTKIEYIRKYINGNGQVVVKNHKIDKKAKIGSLQNVDRSPAPSQVKIVCKPLPSINAKSKIGSLDNVRHQPRGGKKKIYSQRLNWKAKSKVGSLENMEHQPAGGEALVFHQRLMWEANSKDYASPIRQRLLDEGVKVVWTEGQQQRVITDFSSIESVPGGEKKPKRPSKNKQSSSTDKT